MNGITRHRLYEIITKRDGEYCRGCGKLPHEGQLVIDHKDNNNSNNDLRNLQLLCRSCNYLKNPRRPVDLNVREKTPAHMMTEIEISTLKKPSFNKYVAQRINEHGTVEEKDLIYSASKVLGVSPVTAKRWLDVETSSEGIYERHSVGHNIVIRYKKELDFS